MLANMVTSLFAKERIVTTDAKAKEARRQAERLITRAKKGYQAYKEHQTLKESGKEAEAKQMQAVALAHWRQVSRTIRDKAVLKKLFDELAPHFIDREGGYTRILRMSSRLGDNAQTVLLELVGTEITSAPVVRKKRKKPEETEEAEAETAAEEEAPKKKKRGRGKKEEAKAEAEKAEAEAAEAPEAAVEEPEAEDKPDEEEKKSDE